MGVKRLLLIAGASAVIIMAGGTAIAADGSSETAAKPEKQICKRVTRVGSRLGATTCMTRTEWAALDRELRDRARKTAKDTEDRNSLYLNPERAASASPMGPN